MERIIFIILIIGSVSSSQMALADVLTNSLQQRIGDYDIQVNTIPAVPISGRETSINIRITTVSNNPIIDTPIAIKISDEKNELIRTQPILLQSGHYSYNHIFNKAGIFLLSIDILDNPIVGDSNDSNRKLVFDFPITVSDPISVQLTSLTLPITLTVIAIASIILLVLFKKFKSSNKIV
ncbi:MAG TPA: hypothetical protein VHH33_02750 [Nitrososphaeraceae archaeon]|nr:hypothetical protein [Nitrososphaeraceae archaeon]